MLFFLFGVVFYKRVWMQTNSQNQHILVGGKEHRSQVKSGHSEVRHTEQKHALHETMITKTGLTATFLLSPSCEDKLMST